MKKNTTQTEIVDFEARMKALRDEIVVEVQEEIPLLPILHLSTPHMKNDSEVPLVQCWIDPE